MTGSINEVETFKSLWMINFQLGLRDEFNFECITNVSTFKWVPCARYMYLLAMLFMPKRKRNETGEYEINKNSNLNEWRN